jgi:hypothetical protein
MAGRGQKILFVQPSRELISRTISEMLEPLGGRYAYRAIHGDTHGGNVVAGIAEHFRDTARNQGEILCITHAAFLLLPFLERAADWTVIVDEVLQVDLFESFNIPDTHRLITDALAFVPGVDGYGRLLPATWSSSPLSLDQIARNPRSDQVLAQFSGLANRIRSDNWEVYAQRDGFERLIAGDKGGQLQTYSLLNASIFSRFADTIIASACFTDSMLYRLWSARGVALKPVGQEFFDALRYQQHGNGAHVTIQYVLDEHWSKTKRNMIVEGGGTLGDAIISKVGHLLADAPFVWMGNKDQAGAFDHLGNATQLPNSPHGRNDFQQFHNVVVLSALNPPPTHFAFMDTLGVSSDALKTAHYRSAVYQAVMRTSIRNPSDPTQKTVIVMDRPTAHWLADCFPGARVELLNLNIALPECQRGRPRVGDTPLSAAERTRRFRQKKREVSEGVKAPAATSTVSYGSVFPTKYTSVSTMTLELDHADDDSFIALLAELQKRVPTAKEENFLISPATFDAAIEGVDTQRGLANVKWARGIWLDFDDGDLRHADFAAVFPALRFAAFNTYSSTAAQNRWRAFIPTSRDTSADEYATVVQQIERGLVDQRWGRKGTGRQHGLDVSKMHAASMFFAPCQAAANEASFFHDHDELPRAALDVDGWLAAGWSISTTPALTMPSVGGRVDREAAAKAVNAWRVTPKGSGRSAFYALSRRLQRAGMSRAELNELLTHEAQYARSPNERRREIPGLVAVRGIDTGFALQCTKQAGYQVDFGAPC